MQTPSTPQGDFHRGKVPADLLESIEGRSDKELTELDKWVKQATSAGLDEESLTVSLVGSGWPDRFIAWYLQSGFVHHRSTNSSGQSSQAAPRRVFRRVPLAIAVLSGFYILAAIAILAGIVLYAVSINSGIVALTLVSVGLIFIARDILTRNSFGLVLSYGVYCVVVLAVVIASCCLIIMIMSVTNNSDPISRFSSRQNAFLPLRPSDPFPRKAGMP